MLYWGDMNKIKFSPDNVKMCLYCKKIIYNTFRKLEWKRKKYCSQECRHLADRGKPTWNKGKTGWMSEEGRKKVGDAIRERLKTWTSEQRKERHAKSVATRKLRGNFNGQLGKSKEQIYIWKGDKAGYSSKHKWIIKHWTKTGICENCGNSPKPYGNRKFGTEWHSKDHKYNREDRNTWLEVCKSCHNKLDKNL